LFRELAVVVSHKIPAERSRNVYGGFRSHSHGSSCLVYALNTIAFKPIVADTKLALLAWYEGAGGVHMTSWDLIAAEFLSIAHFVEGGRRCGTNTSRAVAWPALVSARRTPGAGEVAMIPVAWVSSGGEGELCKGSVWRH